MGVKTVRKVNEALDKRLKEMQARKKTVQVGVFGAEASRDHGGRSNGFIAQVHEFGSHDGRVPERSFLRSTAKEKRSEITREQAALLNAYLKGKVNIKQALSILGESIVSKVKRKIRSGIDPELTDATKEAKKRGGKSGNTPLIDTGQLINSIRYEVEE